MPLLTIVVPTRSRPRTATECVHELSKIDGDLQILIVDCSPEPSLPNLQANICDPRVQYHHAPPCSMTENWNRAMALVEGKYVTFIGDDDLFLEQGFQLLQEVAPFGYEAIAYPTRATYFWDDFPDTDKAGTLWFADYPDRPEPVVVNTRAETHAILRYQPAELPPVIYHGIVARRVLDQIRDRFGRVFCTVAPDTYLTGLLSGLLERHLVLPVALSLMGKSGPSNSGRILDRGDLSHRKEYTDAERRWHPMIPPVNTVEAHVSDSLLRAFLDLGDEELLSAFRTHFIGGVYAQSMMRNPERAVGIAKHYAFTANPVSNGLLRSDFAAAFGSMIARRAQSRAVSYIQPARKSSHLRHEPCASLSVAAKRTEEDQSGFKLSPARTFRVRDVKGAA